MLFQEVILNHDQRNRHRQPKGRLFVSLSPCEIYERKVTAEQLHAAIASLPDKQAKRIYAHYFLGMSEAEIARSERVNKSQITRSISKALKNIELFLKSRS